MARVRFSSDFRYRPSLQRQICIKYLAEREYTVRRECADQAVEAGAGVEIPAPPRAAGKARSDA